MDTLLGIGLIIMLLGIGVAGLAPLINFALRKNKTRDYTKVLNLFGFMGIILMLVGFGVVLSRILPLIRTLVY